MQPYTDLGSVESALADGSLLRLEDSQLGEVSAFLASLRIINEGKKHTVPAIIAAIDGELTRRQVSRIEEKRSMSEKWFMILAIGSLILTGIGTIVSVISLLIGLGVCR